MEKIILTYQGQRFANGKLAHIYAEDGANPIGFSERIAGWEPIGERVECTRNKDEVFFNFKTFPPAAPLHLIKLWENLTLDANTRYSTTRKTFRQRIKQIFYPSIEPQMRAKLLGKFIILPYRATATFVIARWMAINTCLMSVALDDTATDPEDWFFTVTFVDKDRLSLPDDQLQSLVNEINSEL